MSDLLTQNTPAVQRHRELIWRMEQLRGAEPQEMQYILHSFFCTNTEYSAGADGHGDSNLPHTLGMGTIIQRGLQENDGRGCAVPTYKQINLILSSHSPQDQTFARALSPPHKAPAVTHAAPDVPAHKPTRVPLNKKITTHCLKKTHGQPNWESIFHIATPALLQ